MEYVLFETDWLDIPLRDLPVGDLVICYDPQNRLGKRDGKITWAVVRVIDRESPPEPLGLFWDKVEAVRYAESWR